MRASRFCVVLAATSLCTLAARPSAAYGQEGDNVVLKLKVFDSNNPKAELIPKSTMIFLRNQDDGKPQLLRDRSIEPVPGEKGFYQVRLPKGRLLERLVITVDSASGTNYNPAVISKVVTANSMTIYPGASDPGDTFSFPAFTGQLNEYKGLLAQLTEEFGEAQAEDIKKELRGLIGKQLEVMAQAAGKGRLAKFTSEQRASSDKLLDEVLKLYGLREDEKAAPPPTPAAPEVIHPAYYLCPPTIWYPSRCYPGHCFGVSRVRRCR